MEEERNTEAEDTGLRTEEPGEGTAAGMAEGTPVGEAAGVKEPQTSNDPVSVLKRRAAEKLGNLDIVQAEDIIEAFKDKDEAGRYTTCTQIKVDYWEPESKKFTRSRSRLTTMAPEISLESSGGFTTLVFQFKSKNDLDMTRMWNVLTEYGKEAERTDEAAREVPVLTFTSVPMVLGGAYGMCATDPVFWCMQPSHPVYEECTQIRVLFQPEAVLFLRDETFSSAEVVNKVRNELASERFAEEMATIRKEEAEAFEKAKEAEIAEYLENNKAGRHTFRLTNDDKAEEE